MSWRHELAARLPEEGDPNRSGPPGSSDLRTDILDELEDHLQCAMDREAIGTTDPDVARRRVLDRFGNPATVARRLWLDAMKEQLMNQRLAVGINVLVGAVVVVMAVVTIVTARSGQSFQAELLERMENIAAGMTSASAAAAPVADVDSMQWGKLEVRVVDDLGAPVAEASVELSGAMYQVGQSSRISVVTDDVGRAAFPPVLPGNYRVRTTLPNGSSRNDLIVIALGAPTAHRILAPTPREPDPRPVRFRLTFPSQLDGVAGFAAVEMDLHAADATARGWGGSTIRLAIRHDGKVARLPASPPLLDPQTIPGGISLDAIEWSDTIDVDRGWEFGGLKASMLWLAVDATRPDLVFYARSTRYGHTEAPIRLDEMPKADDEDLVSLRVSDVVLAVVLARDRAEETVTVQTSDTRTSRVIVPSLEWVD